ncbi:uncharacterized protein LOC106398853 [Brassica napus]|uniref:uncharacterized protein LOC106398853 n=1 Tax=Brassica napus TaxID=3708 RepID=UPI0020795106|nr:uncharacterized protein LOC106398853 [Brassica napus]
MGSYPWGRTAYEVLIDSIKTLAPEGGSYTISGMTVALLIWAYESFACFEIKEHGEVRVRRMVLKDSIEEMFPKWSGEPDDPQLGNAQGKRNEKKKKMKGGVSSEAEPPTKKQKKVKTQNESEATAAGKGSSEKEGSKDLELENKVTLTTIVSTLDNISKKFEQFDSRLEAYELDRNKPLMDQKTIDDRVKALLEEHLKVLGVGKIPENNDNPSPPSADKALSFASPRVTTQQNSVNSPALAATPGKVFGPKKNLAKELDKESGVKWTLAEEFGSVAKATDLDSQHIDFVLVSPSKATKDDKDAKVPDYGRGCRGKRTVKGEEADEKKKAAQADAAFKRKEKAEAKKKAAEVKKKDAEAKKKEAEAKKKEAEVVREENEFAPESDVENQEVIRSAVDGTTCMRKNVTPSSVIYDPLAPVDLVLLEKLMQHIKGIPPKPPAPADKPAVLSAVHEGDFYSILIHERPWPEKEYGWVFDNFKIKPSMFNIKGNGYKDMLKGKLPDHYPTNLKWYEDVDHLYGCLQTGGNHWVAYHVDLKKEKIDCYDPIFGEATPKSERRILNSFKPLTHMILYMLSDHIPANIRAPVKKKFSFRRRSKRYTPQNTQIGDCGVYLLKFVECLALGVTFDGINDKNIQGLRMKMAAEILDEGVNFVMSNLLAN